jgi:hypothetical protein|tara:strand:- start:1206 stop:1964 length:759 start_codon:yes stop_codon:yes gene_type:complete
MITNATMDFHNIKYPTLQSGEVCSLFWDPSMIFGIMKMGTSNIRDETYIFRSHINIHHIIIHDGEIYDTRKHKWVKSLQYVTLPTNTLELVYHVRKHKQCLTCYVDIYEENVDITNLNVMIEHSLQSILSCSTLIEKIYPLPDLIEMSTSCIVDVDLSFYIMKQYIWYIHIFPRDGDRYQDMLVERKLLNNHYIFINQYRKERQLVDHNKYDLLLKEIESILNNNELSPPKRIRTEDHDKKTAVEELMEYDN